jgi:phosphoenolpyruvate synthase/pyruvate phosphate dikinase
MTEFMKGRSQLEDQWRLYLNVDLDHYVDFDLLLSRGDPMGSDKLFRTWQGLGASPGIAHGRAHVIRTERDFTEVTEEDILVLRHATPAVLPCLIRARAAICETGGRLCHLAVLARELRKRAMTRSW